MPFQLSEVFHQTKEGKRQVAPPIRTICFDLDDTLCDNEAGEEERLRKALTPLASRLPTFYLEDLVDRALTIDPIHGRLTTLIAEMGLMDPEVTDEAYSIYDQTVGHLTLFPEAAEVLQRLQQRYSLGLVGNGDTTEQRLKIAHLGIERYFNYILIGQEEGCYKPDPEMFQKALTRASVQPEEMLFVGDRIDEDVFGPKALNIRVAWVARGFVRSVPGPVQPDYILRDLRELLRVLEL